MHLNRFHSWVSRYILAGVLSLYALLAVLLTYPLVLNLTRAVPGHGADDPYLAWNIWWTRWSLFNLHSNPLLSNYIFYPIGVNLSSYTLTLLNGVLSIPFQLAWDVIPANNLLVFASIALAAFGAYLLVVELAGREARHVHLGALVAGLIYGLGSYRFAFLYLGHLNFNSNEWLPYYVLFLHRSLALRGRSLRSGLLAGLFFVCAGWTEATFAAFLALLTLLYLLFWLVADRTRFFSSVVWANLLACGFVVLVGLSPLGLAVGADLLRYGNFLVRGSGGAEFLSADLLSFLMPSQHNSLLGGVTRDLTFHNMDFAFVGYATLLCALAGGMTGWWRGAQGTRRGVVDATALRFWSLIAVLMVAIMLGPVLHIANQTVPGFVLLPFRLLSSIPVMSANRLPVRYDHLLMLAIAILAGSGVLTLASRGRRWVGLAVALSCLMLAEHLSVPISLSDLSIPPIYQEIAAEPGDFAILDLPLSWSSSTFVQGQLFTQSQFYQTVHHKRLLGGNTSRPPDFKFQYYVGVPVIHSLILLEKGETIDSDTLAADIQAAPEVERFFDLRYIVAYPDRLNPAVLDYVRQVFGITPIPSVGPLAFRVNNAARGDFTIDPAAQVAQMYFGDDWGRPQSIEGGAMRWATEAQSHLYVPLQSGTDYQMCGMYEGARDGQPVRVLADDTPVGEFRLTTAWSQQCVSIPSAAIHGGLATIVLESAPVPLVQTNSNRIIGHTGVQSPVDLAVTSAGYLEGKFASIALNGQENYVTRRGYTLIALDPNSGQALDMQTFDTFKSEAESERMVEWIAKLSQGTIVAGAVCDEASQHLTQAAVEALGSLGTTLDLRQQFRSSHAFIGVKGALPGTAAEDWDTRFAVSVSAGKNVARPTITLAVRALHFKIVQN
ncbi:MAG: interleukin-like EMT inducer domain-containing protein [Anaerolineae bacterium]